MPQHTRIMIVEDELIVALDLKHNLENLGYKVGALCARAEDAIAKAREIRPDLVLMDINLGEGMMDGTDAAREIRRENNIPIIFLTAYSEEGVLRRAEDSMPYGYLLKPFELRELEATLRMALARRRAEEGMMRSEERLRLAIDTAGLGVWEWEVASRRFVAEGHFMSILGTVPTYFDEGRDAFLQMIHSADRDALSEALARDGQFSGEIRMFVTSGEMRWISLYARYFGEHRRIIGVISDISAIRQAEDRINHLAYHDALTGLGNRHLFQEKLDSEIERAERRQTRLGLLFIDLDGFKIINDSLGHDAGDCLLIEMARRLERVLRGSDVAVRIGGDEFVVIIPDLDRPEHCAVIANHLLGALSQPVALTDTPDPVSITASIGIAVYPDNARSSNELLKACDTAMYSAKAAGRNGYAWFSEEMASRAKQRLVLEQGLLQARHDHSLTLQYQPQIRLADGAMTGVEALARWTHPEIGVVEPDVFIPVAEETGLIEVLGAQLLEEACRQGAIWRASGLDLHLSVNVSVRQLTGSGFIDILDAALERSGFPAGRLELEITETAMLSLDKTRGTLESIRERGVTLSIDDFGTGFSCLSLLQHLPIERLKIDKSFIQGLPDNGSSLALTLAIVSIAHSLGLDIVAEGIETPMQQEQLGSLGCAHGQGFLFAPALPADAIPGFAASRPLR
ncbi:putative bifunctional diguanylate cyclase/phosphodiesterase [Paludibacterium paludis]|uniref:PAS domain S-box-containing protein/diguanylate cyclase (GGDEF)-like protein n=1 Tax=Paludibacterium paludis TaxID=1225769 RepID=A0A918P4P0_9NEIS|nr:EAL domain-containing protein [Paludibacterium paludis]GGY23074.1 hypothetical protein GCM10011289_28540 [Paludibacterium paludis]